MHLAPLYTTVTWPQHPFYDTSSSCNEHCRCCRFVASSSSSASALTPVCGVFLLKRATLTMALSLQLLIVCASVFGLQGVGWGKLGPDMSGCSTMGAEACACSFAAHSMLTVDTGGLCHGAAEGFEVQTVHS